MSWPGYDPFYYHNIPDSNARRSYYGVNAVPWIQVGGLYQTHFPPFIQYYNTRIAVPTSVSVDITGYYDAGAGTIDVSVTATTTETLPAGNYIVYVALAEDNLYYNGTNTTNWHRFVMRDLAPSGYGTSVSFTGDLPQSASVNVDFTMDPTYDDTECHVIAWIQELGSHEVYNSNRALVTDLADLTDATASLPVLMQLGQSFPNPFNPSTAIPVKVSESGSAQLEIVGVDGRRVRTLHSGELSMGDHKFSWDGTDADGNGVASGVYMAHLVTRTGVQSQRLVMLK